MRKPSLSPSKFSTYLACPIKYYSTYLDKRGRWYLKAKSYYSFGSTLHKVLQRFHDSNDQGVKTVHEAVAAVEEGWIDAGYQNAQEMQEALGEGKEIVQKYIESFQRQPLTGETLYLEKQLTLDLGAFNLVGRIDRVDELKDGTLEIIDYKSGRTSVSDQDVQGDLAMACYQLLIKNHHPLHKVKATLYALRSGEKGSYSMSIEELQEFKNDLIQLGEVILKQDYEHTTPVWKELCSTCDFLLLCKKHPGFEIPTDHQK